MSGAFSLCAARQTVSPWKSRYPYDANTSIHIALAAELLFVRHLATTIAQNNKQKVRPLSLATSPDNPINNHRPFTPKASKSANIYKFQADTSESSARLLEVYIDTLSNSLCFDGDSARRQGTAEDNFLIHAVSNVV